jgi:hypothetical protein
MSKSIEYQGYTISSIPIQPVGKQQWKPSIVISSEREGVVSTQCYTDDTMFSTERDADIHGITMGQQIIDGRAPGVLET